MVHAPDPAQLIRHRIVNAVQMLLMIGALALVLAVPAWFLAGAGGVLWALFLATLTSVGSAGMPARVGLAHTGATALRPEQAPGLYELLDELRARAGMTGRLEAFYVPSASLNAFAVGTAADGGLALTDGLLRTLSRRELIGVLAHELSHLRHNDTRVMSMAAAMTRLTVWVTTLVQISLLIPSAIMTSAGLSFLGLGVPPPTPEWGAMLQNSMTWARMAPHVMIFPGLTLMLVVFGFNVLGDGLRDALDPRVRGS